MLFGLCLTTFALGIVTTLAIDHMHARASEAAAPRDSEAVVLQTTPIEPLAKPAPVAAVPAPPPPAPLPSAAAVLPQAAAAEAVVVQLPATAEKPTGRFAEKPAGRPLAHPPVPPPARAARAGAPIRATASHPRTSAKPTSDSSGAGTEAAPDEVPATPAATKKKWVDPFEQ